MAIMRNRTQQGYTNINNSIFRDKRLSIKARGLLCTMLSLPDCWEFSENGLQSILPADGKTSIRTALKTLEECGYLVRRQLREKGKMAGWEWEIFDTSQNAEKPQSEKPQSENPITENPKSENRPQLITNQSTTEEVTTKESKKVRKRNSFDAIIDDYTNSPTTKELLGEWLQNRKAKRAAMTDNAIKRNIDKLDAYAAQSNMSVDDYLAEVIRRGWSAFYPIKSYQGYKQQAQTVTLPAERRETQAERDRVIALMSQFKA